jgi:hypothetical protein
MNEARREGGILLDKELFWPGAALPESLEHHSENGRF